MLPTATPPRNADNVTVLPGFNVANRTLNDGTGTLNPTVNTEPPSVVSVRVPKV